MSDYSKADTRYSQTTFSKAKAQMSELYFLSFIDMKHSMDTFVLLLDAQEKTIRNKCEIN